MSKLYQQHDADYNDIGKATPKPKTPNSKPLYSRAAGRTSNTLFRCCVMGCKTSNRLHGSPAFLS